MEGVKEIGVRPKQEKMSRRDFLKKAGVVAGAVAVGVGGAVIEEKTGAISRALRSIKELFLGSFPFEEIVDKSNYQMNVSGYDDKKAVYFNYFNRDMEKLFFRLGKESSKVFQPFVPGQESVRYLGEVTEDKLWKVAGKSNSLPEDRQVEMFPDFTINQFGYKGVKFVDFSNENLYALQVIVAPNTYFDDLDTAPFEINGNAPKNDEVRNQEKFGKGLVLGTLEPDGTFNMVGIVGDARALVLE